MSQNISDGEFWLPPEFLTDDDILMNKSVNTNRLSSLNDGFGLYNGGFKSSFPYEFPNGFGSFGFSSEVNSPVESVVGSTETESEEEDNLTALLSMKMAHSALDDELGGNNSNRAFRYDNPKGWVLSRSPQSTLSALERGCGCRHGSSRGHPSSQSKFSSPSRAWDLLYAAAGEVDRMKISQEYNYETGFLGPPSKHTPFTGPVKNAAINGDFYSRQSLSHLRLQATQLQQLKQQQMLKQQQAAMWSLRDEQFQHTQLPVQQHRGRTPEFVGNRANCRPLGLSPSAFPPPLQQTGSGKRAVLPGNPATQKPCAGTGVFLPRRMSNPVETRKKPGCSTVLVPVKVMQALNLNLDNIGVETQMQPRFNFTSRDNESAADAAMRLNNANAAHYNRRNNTIIRPQQAMNNEIRLPQEWTY